MIEQKLSCLKTLNAVCAWLMIIIWSGAYFFYEMVAIFNGIAFMIGPLIVNLLILYYGIFNVRVL